jgi:hypothetical protein
MNWLCQFDELGDFFAICKPIEPGIANVTNQGLKSYDKQREALQTTCRASLIYTAMLAFFWKVLTVNRFMLLTR